MARTARVPVYSKRLRRNLNPHAEALLAKLLWSQPYSEQRGGVMDFWDGLSPQAKKYVSEQLEQILAAPRA